MPVATIVLAVLLVVTAARKLSHQEAVVATYTRVGVPESRLNVLAAILLAGAAGLLAGLAWAPIGLAAAAGLTIYFLVAIAFHIRSRDLAHLPMPVAYEALAVIVLIFQIRGR